MNPLEDEEEDAWPDEPEEFDPGSLGPGAPAAPAAPEVGAGESDVPEELFRAFWGTVVMANVALFALSLGVLLLVFRRDWWFGGGALLVGLVATAFGARLYYRYRTDDAGPSRSDATAGRPGEED